MKFLLTFLSISLMPMLSYAQISIEERVEINPANQQIMSDDPTSSHAIQLDVQWDTPQYNAAIVGAVVPCQSAYADWQNGGTISLSISDARAGLYRLQPRFNTPSGVLTHVTYQLYFDGIGVLSGERDVPGGYSGSFPYFNIDYTPPLASNYNLSLGNNVSCILTPTAITISTFNDCSTGISWNKNTQPVNLLFVSGGEFASFYDANQQIIGDNYSGTFSELQSINIIQDSVYRASEDKYFIVQCEWGGVVKTDSVRLLTQIGDVIVANTSGEDSLYTGQEVSVELYANDFGGACTIFFPFEATYNAEIIEGNEYGNLLEPYTGIPVQSFTGLGHYFGMSGFNYVADGISPDTVKSVVIRISTSDPKIPYTDLNLYIKPPPIYVYTVPDVVGADDTADVIIKHRLEDGTLLDFPPDQTFELAVLDGCVNGNFMVGDSINVYFENALQPVKFVTADSLESDSGYVRLRVGTDVSAFMSPVSNNTGEEEKQLTNKEGELIGGTGYTRAELKAGFKKMMKEKRAERLAEKMKGEPPLEAPVIEACALDQSAHPFYWEGNAKYEDDKIVEILLGETKYFQAKYPDPLSNELVIEEVQPGPEGVPQLNGGLPNDVWGNNPVSIVTCDSCAKKMGVYWEKKYPTNDFIEEKIPHFNKKFKLIEMENFSDHDLNGLIRVIGRYWSPDSTYIVKLKAKRDSDSTEIKLRVIKPSKLFSSTQTTSYRRARDVGDNEFNIDSLCILFGGKYGIPPQFIKGQMKTESATKTFTFDDGTSGKGFAPSYRYEPFTTQYNNNLKKDKKYNTYYIFDSSYTFADVPTNHQHVRFINYPRTIKTVWDMIEQYSKLVNPNPSINYYGGRDAATHRVWFGYTVIDTVYSSFEKRIRDENPTWTDLQVYDSTNTKMIEHLKYEWRPPKSRAPKGTKNNISQTRVASSYGLAQFLYGTARDIDYPKEDLPENINQISNLELFYETQKKYLQKGMGNDVESENNWNDGYDYSFCRRIYVPRWNQDTEYAKTLINNSKLFLPKK